MSDSAKDIINEIQAKNEALQSEVNLLRAFDGQKDLQKARAAAESLAMTLMSEGRDLIENGEALEKYVDEGGGALEARARQIAGQALIEVAACLQMAAGTDPSSLRLEGLAKQVIDQIAKAKVEK